MEMQIGNKYAHSLKMGDERCVWLHGALYIGFLMHGSLDKKL